MTLSKLLGFVFVASALYACSGSESSGDSKQRNAVTDPNNQGLGNPYAPGMNPDGTYPNGFNPNGSNPGGTNPNGSNPNGANPNGSNPNGTNPNGTNPTGGTGGPTTGIGTGGDSGAFVGVVPMSVFFDSDDGSNVYGGPISFSAKVGGVETQLVSFKGGDSDGKNVIQNLCDCSKKNEMELVIRLNGAQLSLANVKHIAKTSHIEPTDASDWEDYLDDINVKPGLQTVYFGGFDHVFLSGTRCPLAGFNFACDADKWNNRDDTKVVFMCHFEKCTNKSPNAELFFIGQ